jgi:hypothetical protein
MDLEGIVSSERQNAGMAQDEELIVVAGPLAMV